MLLRRVDCVFFDAVDVQLLTGLLLALLAVIGVIFAATTYDSASYNLAASSCKQLEAEEDPKRVLRMYWAIFLGLLPSALLFIGGLETIKTATIMASFPILFIYVVMMISVTRMLKTT